MRVGLSQLLIMFGAIGATAGVFGANGAGPGLSFLIALLVSFFCVARCIAKWKNSTSLRRSYAIVTSFASIALLAYVTFAIATSPTIVRERLARDLASQISGNERLSQIELSCIERGVPTVVVNGVVKSEDDFWDLNELLIQFNWNEPIAVNWNIAIEEPSGAVTAQQHTIPGPEEPFAKRGLLAATHRTIQRWMFRLR